MENKMIYHYSHSDINESALETKRRMARTRAISRAECEALIGKDAIVRLEKAMDRGATEFYSGDKIVAVDIMNINYIFKATGNNKEAYGT